MRQQQKFTLTNGDTLDVKETLEPSNIQWQNLDSTQ